VVDFPFLQPYYKAFSRPPTTSSGASAPPLALTFFMNAVNSSVELVKSRTSNMPYFF
jgi:hypothetical protein